MSAFTGRSLLSISELAPADVVNLVGETIRYKIEVDANDGVVAREPLPPTASGFVGVLIGRRSLRTRVATHVAAKQLGIECLDLPWEAFYADPTQRTDHSAFAQAEITSLAELGCSALVVRIVDHAVLDLWRTYAELPIINACSDRAHPLQALTDAAVLTEAYGGLRDVRLTFVGNGASPIARSLLALSARSPLRVRILAPVGYQPEAAILESLGLELACVWTPDPASALTGADVVYADEVWYRRSTAEEDAVFAPFRVTNALLDTFCPDARIMHCLPHSDEIDSEALERSGSLVRAQLRMRVSATRAVLLRALG